MLRRSTLLFAGLVVMALLGSGLAQSPNSASEDNIPTALDAQPDVVLQSVEVVPLDAAEISGSTQGLESAPLRVDPTRSEDPLTTSEAQPEAGSEDSTSSTSSVGEEAAFQPEVPASSQASGDGAYTSSAEDQYPPYTPGTWDEPPSTADPEDDTSDPVAYTNGRDQPSHVDHIPDGRMYKHTSMRKKEHQQPQPQLFNRRLTPTPMPGSTPRPPVRNQKLPKGVQLPSAQPNIRTRLQQPTDNVDPTNTAPTKQDGPDAASYDGTKDPAAPNNLIPDGRMYKDGQQHGQQPQLHLWTRVKRGPAYPSTTHPANGKHPHQQHQKPPKGDTPAATYQQQPEAPQVPADQTQEAQQLPSGSHTKGLPKGGKTKVHSMVPHKVKATKPAKDQASRPHGKHIAQPDQAQVVADANTQTAPMVPEPPPNLGTAASVKKVPQPIKTPSKRPSLDKCPAGSLTHEDGTCMPCEANTFSTKPGATSCTPCPAGKVSEAGAKHCHKAKAAAVPLPLNQ